jgi:uncharacterized alkaline shock family protein YloU
MSINKHTELGKINITNKAIASLVADAALECYGVVGLCAKDDKAVILPKEKLEKVILVSEEKEGYVFSFNIIVALGVKVTEILRSVQKEVKYVVERTFDIRVAKVNIFVQDLKKVE